MTTVTLNNGKTFSLDWNLYSMTMMEFFAEESPVASKSKLANATMMILAAIHGGMPDCTLNLETLQREIGKDMQGFCALIEAATKEYMAFEQLNKGIVVDDKKKETNAD